MEKFKRKGPCEKCGSSPLVSDKVDNHNRTRTWDCEACGHSVEEKLPPGPPDPPVPPLRRAA